MRHLLIALFVTLLLACLPSAAPAAAGPVLVLGDSLSQGLSASSPDHAFPAVLSGLLGTPVTTLGQSGRTLAGVVAQWDAYDGPTPAILVIEIGVNDATTVEVAPDWLPRYRALIADAQARGVARVVVVTPGPVHSATPGYEAAVANYADAARSLADVAIVADTWPTLGDCAACYEADGVHPLDAGHAEIARLIAAAIETRVWLPAVRSSAAYP